MSIFTDHTPIPVPADQLVSTVRAVMANVNDGWLEHNLSHDYLDIEKEIVISNQEKFDAEFCGYHSLNLQITFELENNEFYCRIGDNKGNGFNNLIDISGIEDSPSTLAEAMHRSAAKDASSADILFQHQNEISELVASADRLIAELRRR